MFLNIFSKTNKPKRKSSVKGYSSNNPERQEQQNTILFKTSFSQKFNTHQHVFKKTLQPLFINAFQLKHLSDETNNFSWFRRGLRIPRASHRLIKSQRPRAPRMLMFLRSSREQRSLVQTTQLHRALLCQWRPLLRRVRRRFLVKRRSKRGQRKHNPLTLQAKLKTVVTRKRMGVELYQLGVPQFLLTEVNRHARSFLRPSRSLNGFKDGNNTTNDYIYSKTLNADCGLIKQFERLSISKSSPHSPVNLNSTSLLPALVLLPRIKKKVKVKRRFRKKQNKFTTSVDVFYKNFISRPKSRRFSR